jgi:hypothetical protein
MGERLFCRLGRRGRSESDRNWHFQMSGLLSIEGLHFRRSCSGCPNLCVGLKIDLFQPVAMLAAVVLRTWPFKERDS